MRKGIVGLGIAAAVLSVVLLGCMSTQSVVSDNAIQTEQAGFSPNGDSLHSTIDFAVIFADTKMIKRWRVEMVATSGTKKQWSGNALNLPTTLSWDGRTEAGPLAPEGSYVAMLTVEYPFAYRVTARSNIFILDVTPPTGHITFSPDRFVPDAGGMVPLMTVSIAGSSTVASMDSWSLDILDQHGREFRSFDGVWTDNTVTWDGKSIRGDWVSPAQSYIAQATLRDEFGNSSQIYSTITVGDLALVKPNEPAAAPGILSVIPASGGFAPSSDNNLGAMNLALFYGARIASNSWKLEIVDSHQLVQKTFSGKGDNQPANISWNGKNDAGALAAEGMYTARLSVDYGTAFSPGTASSTPFVLDITPPSGSITLSDPLFSPIEASPTITLNVNASSPVAKIDSWRMEIYDPANHLFQTFTALWQAPNAVWDGRGFRGDLVQSAEDYPVVVKVRDEYGNVGVLTSDIPVDILIEKTATGFRILNSRIFFQPYTANYTNVRPELAAQNAKRLTAMALKLKKFPDYKINLVGHASMFYWNDVAKGDVEQRDVLLPLSKARADAVKDAMVTRGVAAVMFTTSGVGASDQLVPDSDLADLWQNRRVSFFIDK